MTVNTSSSVTGLGGNPALNIDAVTNKGTDAYIVYDTSDELLYLNGSAVRCDGPKKQLLDTGWYTAGTLRDNMLLMAVFKRDRLSSTGTEIDRYIKAIDAKIYKRNPTTKEVVKVTDVGYAWGKLSQKTGVAPKMYRNNSNSVEWFNFDPRYEYKIQMYTSSSITENQSIILDYLYLVYYPRLGVTVPRQMYYSTTDDNTRIEPVQVMDYASFAISTDSSGYGTVTITQQTPYAAGVTNQMSGYMNSVSNIIPTWWTGSSNGGALEIEWVASTSGQGGYTVILTSRGGYASATVYGMVTIIGDYLPLGV